MRSLRTCLAASILTLALAGAALASVPSGISNGDFCQGDFNWNPQPPANWTITFPAAGGNPDCYARIQSPFGQSAGTGSITQTFNCGEPGIPGNCVITFDYRLESIDASPGTARVHLRIDGAIQFTSPSADSEGWRNVTVTVPCGVHVLTLELEVDPTNNGWAACFDNVFARCEPIVPTAPSTWGRIKSLIIE